jgi:hypothetical protein
MNREQLLELWNDQVREGNWVPSWPDSLKDLDATAALWKPDSGELSHCIWQEVVHVIYWREVTLDILASKPRPTQEECERLQFALPETTDEAVWVSTVAELYKTHDALAAAIAGEAKDLSRIHYHLIHDAYHLGRITQLRALQGTAPSF